jgi:lipopolysaccharide export system permease protein
VRGTGGLLDRYVLRRYVGAYGLCLFGLVMLFLVVDFFGHMDKFFAAGAADRLAKAGYTTWPLIGEYYATRLPMILSMVGPYLALFAAVAVLITFARHNELVPMIAAGRSHHRVLAPAYLFAALAALTLFALEERVVPTSMRRNTAIDAVFEGGSKGESKRAPQLRDPTTKAYFAAQRWVSLDGRLVGVMAPSYRDPTGKLPEGVFEATELRYRRHPTTREVGWYPVGGTLTPAVSGHGGVLPPPIRLPQDKPIAFSMTPADIDLLTAASDPTQSRADLDRLIAQNPHRNDLRMRLYTRTTRPVSSLVLLLLGVPFFTKPGQKSVASGLGVALALSAVYVATDFFFLQIGNRGELSPLVAAWFAPSFFGAVALARLDGVSA